MSSIPLGMRNNPGWDALRIQSLNGLGGLISDNQSTGAFGGLENKIYLWLPDGSPLLSYAVTEAGLNDALTASREGGAITLPSMQIDLTASITIPIGVALIGLSHDGSILSFSGLSAASAIVHSARSTLEHLTVIVDGSQPLIGVNARAAKARVRHVAVYMASHANNIKIYAGYPESAP